VNPVVILPGALAARSEALAEGFVGSVTLGTGQFCTNPGLVLLVKSAAADAFIETIRSKMASREAGVLLNPAIERGLTGAVESTIGRGTVQLLTGGAAVEGDACRYANTVLTAESVDFIHDAALQTEHFGPVTLIVRCDSTDQLNEAIQALHGNLTGTLQAESSDLEQAAQVAALLREKVGRLIWNGFPTGVEVVHAMQHGGPYPATTAPATTSVGMTAVQRFLRPVAYQNMPEALLPPALHNANPLGIWRIVNNEWTKAGV
jgi:NADP-dependent aldehyde dehydrogenase